MAERKDTFRSLVISALERALEEDDVPFQLRDVAVGEPGGEPVSSAAINRAIDAQRDPSFTP